VIPEITAKIIRNDELAKRFFSIECEWESTQSHEAYFDSKLGLFGTDYLGVSTSNPNQIGDKMDIPA